MATVTYDKEITALLVIDPYNDFISEGGKVWPSCCVDLAGMPRRRTRIAAR